MIWLIVLIQICSSSSMTSAIAVQDERLRVGELCSGIRRAELARAMLSRSPQSHLTSLSSAKVLYLTRHVNSLADIFCENLLIKCEILVNLC